MRNDELTEKECRDFNLMRNDELTKNFKRNLISPKKIEPASPSTEKKRACVPEKK
jgi:hypothetical protein